MQNRTIKKASANVFNKQVVEHRQKKEMNTIKLEISINPIPRI